MTLRELPWTQVVAAFLVVATWHHPTALAVFVGVAGGVAVLVRRWLR
jgi:hypothetical protein